MMQSYAKFQEAQRDLNQALEWDGLLAKSDWQSKSATRISPAHSSLKLTIPIQFSSGGKNYWESPQPLNASILWVLAETEEGRAVIDRAIRRLRHQNEQALIACKSDIDAISAKINGLVEQTA